MHSFIPRASRLALLAGGVTIAVSGALAVAPAGAQVSPTLSVVPDTILVGESATVTATGCVAEGVDQADLFVILTVNGTQGEAEATDAEGTATVNSGIAGPDDVGDYTITGGCYQDTGEGLDLVFEYEQTVVLSVVTSTTTTAAPTTTTTARVADVVTVAPAFTG